MRNTRYTLQLTQGQGMINETLLLLPIYQENMSKENFLEYIRVHDTLSCQTDRRLKNIVFEVFYPRYMKNNPKLPLWLSRIRNNGLPLKQFNQLLMIYCAKEHAVFFDTVVRILNPLKNDGVGILSNVAIPNFVTQIVESGQASWSESTRKRNASYIRSILIDFEFIDKKGNILPYTPADFTILYLMHEQHFAGLSDMAIWDMEEWQLFNLDRHQVLARIMDLSLRGAYIAQTSGDLLTISWNYQTMEEFIDATL